MLFSKAIKIANHVVERLAPYCEPGFIHIAGSVRREKPGVKDVEVCCIPKKEFIPTDLFGGGMYVVNRGFGDTVNSMAEQIIKGNHLGRYMQIVLIGSHHEKLDLFMPVKDDYFRMFVIRTGSVEYVWAKIAAAWVKLGWCGTADGLRRMQDCLERKGPDGKNYWRCINKSGEKPPAWQSEAEFFNWLGVNWIDPHMREWKDVAFKRELYK